MPTLTDKRRGREIAYDLLEEGIISAEKFAEACIQWMTNEGVMEMMWANEFYQGPDEEDEDE
jgi:hypothetical protein